MIYFISDTHFYHSNIIHLSNRPFKDVETMNKRLIQNWNSYVTERDEIYVLGDFLHQGTALQANEILSKLKGKKYLIRGNHDRFVDHENFDQQAFEWIKDYYVLNHEKRKFVLFHYPILEWAGFFGDSIHLYGHVHNSSKDPDQKARLDVLGKRAFNVGVDMNNFYPVSIKTIISKVEEK